VCSSDLTFPGPLTSLIPALSAHLSGIRDQIPSALMLIGALTAIHVLGIIDDRRPLGPFLKIAMVVGVSTALIMATDTRLLTLLDSRAGGPWLSIAITVGWFVVITNAMNFMDNMDGLTGGVTVIAGACLLAAALLGGQWFVAAMLALLVGSTFGFLVLNFPPARIFMGDGGSLVIGFLLAFLTTRTTYYDPAVLASGVGGIHSVLIPLIVLAIPLYDFSSVTLIRLRQGKSPFVGDLGHHGADPAGHRRPGRGSHPGSSQPGGSLARRGRGR